MSRPVPLFSYVVTVGWDRKYQEALLEIKPSQRQLISPYYNFIQILFLIIFGVISVTNPKSLKIGLEN